MPYKPMLAATILDTAALKYPLFVSEKLDGIRCVIENGVAYSRSGKPIRSPVVHAMFSSGRFDNMDGELIYGDKNAKDVFNKTTSACMSKEWPEELDPKQVKFYVFDKIPIGDSPKDVLKPYQERYQELAQELDGVAEFDKINVWLLPQTKVDSEKELLAIEEHYLNLHAEGVMCRSINGIYKHGRSTLKDGIIGKLKRFTQSECVVVGFQEKMTNTNEKKRDEFGYADRSTSKEGMVAAGTLGAFECKDLETGVLFTMGSGLNDELRTKIWNNKEDWLGKILTYKYFAIGVSSDTLAPRFPIFIGQRDKDDM